MTRKGDYIFIETGVGDFVYEANIKRIKPEFWIEHLKEKNWWSEEYDELEFLRLCEDERI